MATTEELDSRQDAQEAKLDAMKRKFGAKMFYGGLVTTKVKKKREREEVLVTAFDKVMDITGARPIKSACDRFLNRDDRLQELRDNLRELYAKRARLLREQGELHRKLEQSGATQVRAMLVIQ